MRKLITFNSGLKMAHVYDPRVRSVAIGVFVGAGAVHESDDLSGISHFIEHMVFKGTKNRSGFDIVNTVDSVGAQINAYTAKSYTCFHTVSLDSNAEKCADVLSDMYFDPTFDGEELEKERQVVIEEINESEDTPDDVCLERLFATYFKGSPLARPILGTKKTLAAMTSEKLFAYRDRMYVPSNTVLSVAGNINEADAVALAEKYFENRMRSAVGKEPPLAPVKTHSALAKKKKHIEQTHIAFAFPCYSYGHERMPAVQLLTAIFGTEMSSRLFQSVRERRGLCYTVLGYPSSYENNGAYVIYAALNPARVEEAVAAIREEIDLLLEKGVLEEEVSKGKEQLKTSLLLGQESTSSMMRAFGTHAVQTGKLFDVDKRIADIDALNENDVLDAARFIFDYDKASASIVAEQPDIDILKLLKNA